MSNAAYLVFNYKRQDGRLADKLGIVSSTLANVSLLYLAYEGVSHIDFIFSQEETAGYSSLNRNALKRQ